MNIEFTGEASYTKFHYGTLISDIGQQYDFTLIDNYDSNPDHHKYEIVWPDGPPHNWKYLEKLIIEEFNQPKL